MALLEGPRYLSSCHGQGVVGQRGAFGVFTRDLLGECDGSAERLQRLLGKDALREECARRGLPISGTKVRRAPRFFIRAVLMTG